MNKKRSLAEIEIINTPLIKEPLSNQSEKIQDSEVRKEQSDLIGDIDFGDTLI
jgi:hypothetical protein